MTRCLGMTGAAGVLALMMTSSLALAQAVKGTDPRQPSVFGATLKGAVEPIECHGVGWPQDYQPVPENAILPSTRAHLRGLLAFPQTRLAPLDVSDLIAEDEASTGSIGRQRIGVLRNVDTTVLGEWHGTDDGGSMWAATVVSEGAKSVRLHFSELDLPPGARVYYYAPDAPLDVATPVEGRGPTDDGTFWSVAAPGESVNIELYLPPGAAQEVPFGIDEVVHNYRTFEDGAGERATLECMIDVHCAPQWPTWESISYSVARIEFVDGGSFVCTGQLLATGNNDLTPYFLTANHCIRNQTVADTMAFRWFYQTSSCNGSLMSMVFTSGATFLTGDGGRDWSLLMVKGVIPPGAFWSGWTAATINTGVTVHSISHPLGSWKRYARATKLSNTSNGYQKVSFDQDVGTIDHGSSGSGIWTDGATPATQLLFGDCSHTLNTDAGCDNPTNPVYYGRFQQYYPQIATRLAAGPDDTFENDDSCAAAIDLASGSYSDLVVKSLDEDWYKFSVGVQPLNVTLTFTDNYGNIDAQLYDACGGNVVASASSFTNNESLSYNNPGPTATFYLRVYLSDDTRNEYAMSISGASVDCNNNGIEDPCDTDCGLPGCNVPGCGQSPDCNENLNPDDCDILNNISDDCNDTLIPDECETAAGTAPDCNSNSVPDDCDLTTGLIPDCNENGVPDSCDFAAGTSEDCNANTLPDDCDIANGFAEDCNGNGIPDICDTGPGGESDDCNDNNTPDECDLVGNDCDANNIPDDCDEAALALTISAPGDLLRCPDDSAQFTVSAAGATGYQWYRNDTELLSNGGAIAGATSATLTIDPVTIGDDLATYSCEVSFGCLSARSPSATLDVVPTDIEITLLSPSPITGCANGGNIALQVAIDDTTGATYQWSKDGEDLVDDERVSGAQTDILFISNVTSGDSGAYTCTAVNFCMEPGEGASTTGLLGFVDPLFTQTPNDVCAEEGSQTIFHASATSSETFVLRWFEGINQLADGAKFSGTHTETLTVKNIQLTDDGRQFHLRAIVLNPGCSADSPPGTLTALPVGECPACSSALGDMDGDGDYDLVDMQRFAACFGADVTVQEECACANVDDGNNVVDLADWMALEPSIAGPN